jgi:hypothetical protein
MGYNSDDMIEYANWVYQWCEQNKYRKTIDGATPYGSGNKLTNQELFDIYYPIKQNAIKLTNQSSKVKPDMRTGDYSC